MSIGGLLVLVAVLALIPAWIASRKGLSGFWFWVISVFFLPLGVLLALIGKDARRKCPHCAEPIQPQATVCPHCQRELAIPGGDVAASGVDRSEVGVRPDA